MEKEFPDDREVKPFVETFAPLLAQAMGLRSLPISDEQSYRHAKKTKQAITDAVQHSASASRTSSVGMLTGSITGLTTAMAPMAPPTTTSRNVSCAVWSSPASRLGRDGSQSDAGAKTREILMSVLLTLKQRFDDFQARFKNALDHLTQDPNADPYNLLFEQNPP